MVGMKPFRNYRPEPRRMGNVAIIASMLVSFCILSLIKARYCPPPQSQSGKPQPHPQPQPTQLGSTIREEIKMVTEEELIEDEDEEPKPLCAETHKRSDVCEAQGNVRIQESTRTIFVNPATADREWKIKPYARKGEDGALKHVAEWTFKPHQAPPACTHNHTSPALLFSVGGFTGNLFHDFTDVLVPLFAAARRFNGDVHLLTADTKPWWVGRFKLILKHLTKHEIVDLGGGDAVRCYPAVTAGLSFYKELGINASAMPAFRSALRESFGLERRRAMTDADGSTRSRPRLLIISRKQSRKFLNENGMVAMATSLGFEVRVGEPSAGTELAKFARLVNSADVMIGVHGAGLTNMVFLPEGAVVVQVVPFGGLEWVARNSFKYPASEMGVGYLEYTVGEEESSVAEQYPRDDPVRRDPMSVQRKGWSAMRAVYLDKQDVRPHLGSLRKTLMEAVKILPQSGKGST